MGVLTGPQILQEMAQGHIQISPFNESQINTNSYNLRLSDILAIYDNHELDMQYCNPHHEIQIPLTGLVLEPGKLYLGSTIERTATRKHVGIVEGRSSVGRLGLCVHVTAGFIDTGFDGTITLELVTTQPLRVYAGVEICQIAFSTLVGDIRPYTGKYQGQEGPQPSGIWREFLKRK